MTFAISMLPFFSDLQGGLNHFLMNFVCIYLFLDMGLLDTPLPYFWIF